MQAKPSLEGKSLILACGALANEIVALKKINDWTHIDLQCLAADLHNRPEKIPAALEAKLEENQGRYAQIFIAYADCGTGGLLDAMLEKYKQKHIDSPKIERIAGAHCYEFFMGAQRFAQMHEAELGTLYLTDFFLRHFERIIIKGLGIDKHPELLSMYFGNYTRLVFMAQMPKSENEHNEQIALGQAAADRLGLRFEYLETGLAPFAQSLQPLATNERPIQWLN